MKKIFIISLILLIQNNIVGQNNELISNILKNQNIERIDSIAKKLNYKGGDIIKVIATFTVNENGEIKNVKARGPHPLFEEEAIKIINSIPKLDQKKFLNGLKEINYLLPINFVIETDKERKTREKKEKRKMEKELKRMNNKN